MPRQLFLSKKAITQADWAISLGIFILYLAGVILLAQPFLRSETTYDSQLNKIFDFLDKNIIEELSYLPIILNSNQTEQSVFMHLDNNPLFLKDINESKTIKFFSISENKTKILKDFLIHDGYFFSISTVQNQTENYYLIQEKVDSEEDIINSAIKVNNSQLNPTYNRSSLYSLIVTENSIRNPTHDYRVDLSNGIINSFQSEGIYGVRDFEFSINNQTISATSISESNFNLISNHNFKIPEIYENDNYRPEINFNQYLFGHKPYFIATLSPKYDPLQEHYKISTENNETTIKKATYDLFLDLELFPYNQYTIPNYNTQSYLGNCEDITTTQIIFNNASHALGIRFNKKTTLSFCDLGSITNLTINLSPEITEDITYEFILGNDKEEIEEEFNATNQKHFTKKLTVLDVNKASLLSLIDYFNIKQKLNIPTNHDFKIEIYERLFITNETTNLTTVEYNYISNIGKNSTKHTNVYSSERRYNIINQTGNKGTALINVQFW